MHRRIEQSRSVHYQELCREWLAALATRVVEAYYFHAKPWIEQHLRRFAARIGRE